MNWHALFGVIAAFSLLLPAATITYHRLYQNRSLAALMITYLIAASYILMSLGMIPASKPVIKAYGLLNNFLDTPLMLVFLVFFCPIRKPLRTVYSLIALFMLYELVVLFVIGFSREAVVYISGPGVALIMIYALYLFSRQVKFTVHHGKNLGRTLMLAAVLFSYGCYALVYVFYYVQKTSFVRDVFVLYFFSSIASAVVMTIGLNLVRKRLKELREVQNTRKELALFFKNG